MKRYLTALTLALSAIASAQEPVATPAPDAAAPAHPPREILEKSTLPQVSADVLMILLPEEKAMQLLPELRDAAKIEAAQAKLMALVAQKQATLVDWPQVIAVSEDRAVTTNVVEEKYPIEFEGPAAPSAPVPDKVDPLFAKSWLMEASLATPTTFETRNTGSTLEVEPTVSADGKSVSIQFTPKYVRLLREKTFPAGADPKKSRIIQPIFQEHKVTTVVNLRDGERTLLYFGKVSESNGQVLLFIGGVKIVPGIK